MISICPQSVHGTPLCQNGTNKVFIFVSSDEEAADLQLYFKQTLGEW